MAVGALLAGSGVLAGALGAHALEASIPADRLASFELAAQYHLLHGIAVVGIAGGMSPFDKRRLAWACWTLVAGTVTFAGALYLLSLTGNTGWAAMAPVGGALLLAGWLLVLAGARKVARHPTPEQAPH